MGWSCWSIATGEYTEFNLYEKLIYYKGSLLIYIKYCCRMVSLQVLYHCQCSNCKHGSQRVAHICKRTWGVTCCEQEETRVFYWGICIWLCWVSPRQGWIGRKTFTLWLKLTVMVIISNGLRAASLEVKHLLGVRAFYSNFKLFSFQSDFFLPTKLE